MSWLLGYTLASMVGAFIVVRIFDYLLSGLGGVIGHVARAVLFVGTWTAVTVTTGLRDFSQRVQRFKWVHRAVSSRIAPVKRGDIP